MSCREVDNLLPEYSAEALPRQQMERVREHLEGCQACRQAWEQLGGALRLVEAFGAVAPPPGLWHGVRHRLEAGEARPLSLGQRWRAWLAPGLGRAGVAGAAWRLATGAVAAVALAAALWNVYAPGHRPSEPAPMTISDPEIVAAAQFQALAATGQPFADRAGLESVVQLVRQRRVTH